MMKIQRIVLAILVLAICPSLLWANQLVIFGDSLSDMGNVYTGSTNNPPLQPDPPSPPYYQGRMSNGPIWVEYLADMLGTPQPTASLNGGTNYAYAGATTDSGTRLRSSIAIPGQTQIISNIGKQVNDFLVDHQNFTPDQLVILWGGANDLANATLAGPVNGPGIVTSSIQNLQNYLRTFDANGAERILVPNQIDASTAPFWNGFGPPLPPGLKTLLAILTQSFNAQLDTMLNSLLADPTFQAEIYRVDMSSLFGSVLTDPGQFGFTNTAAPAFIPGQGQVADPTGFLFWDPIHPTTEGHRLIAQAAYAAIPAPATLPLFIVGALLGLVPALRRYRRLKPGSRVGWAWPAPV